MVIGPTATSALNSKDTAAEFVANQSFVGLYLMHYRHPNVGNHVLNKNFRFNGSLKEAKERAEKHCQTLGLRLMFVEPLISDLTKEEQLHLGGLGQ